MGKIIGICIALLLFAVGFVLVAEQDETTALYEAFMAQPPLVQAAWATIAVVPLVIVFCAILLLYLLMRHRRAARGLEQRLEGVRAEAKRLMNAQADAEATVHQLARSDPEDAMAALQQRLTEAERFAHVQQTRNEASDLQSRVDHIRTQQGALKQRLAPMLEKRRGIEQLFAELGAHQNDLDRVLDEIASGDDTAGLDVELKKIADALGQSHGRCDDIERISKTVAGLKEDYLELRTRLAPFKVGESGIAARVEELNELRDNLATNIDSVMHTSEGPLAERVQKFTEDKKMLDGRLSAINDEFSRLTTLRRDIGGLVAGFHNALDALGDGNVGAEGVPAADARAEELKTFINETQTHLDEIERRTVVFRQLRSKLGEVQTRLAPLEAQPGGVLNILDELKELRDRLAAKLRRMEESEDGDLAERLKKFTESKMELEQRVSMLNEEFVKLAATRKDIAGLFEKLNAALKASAT